MSQAMPVETWRKILYVENGKYYTFELDDEFNIIGEKEKVDGPLPGDYFRIPFVSGPLQLDYRIRLKYLTSPTLTGRNEIF